MIMMVTIISLHPHNAQHNKIQELHIGDFYQERITEETFLKKVRFWTSIAMSRKIHEFQEFLEISLPQRISNKSVSNLDLVMDGTLTRIEEIALARFACVNDFFLVLALARETVSLDLSILCCANK